MSHELRTPLNAILGYTELIADGIYGPTPDKMQDVLGRVQNNGKPIRTDAARRYHLRRIWPQ